MRDADSGNVITKHSAIRFCGRGRIASCNGPVFLVAGRLAFRGRLESERRE